MLSRNIAGALIGVAGTAVLSSMVPAAAAPVETVATTTTVAMIVLDDEKEVCTTFKVCVNFGVVQVCYERKECKKGTTPPAPGGS